MTYILSSIILILLIVMYAHYRSNKRTDKQLQHISKKVDAIISEESSEQLLVVTNQKDVVQVLTQMNRLLNYIREIKAESIRMKMSINRMLMYVSHDLRTPLTVILGNVETLRENPNLSPEKRDLLLSKVQSKEKEVLHVINTFFDLAKLDSGDWKMDWKRIHINEICRKIIFGYYDMLTNQDFKVSIDIPETPIFIYADEDAIYRMLDNLLSNAVHYGKDGDTIGLTLRTEHHDVLIDVWDNGKGIPEKEQKHIFKPMFTLNESQSISTNGSGIGLTITKQLTEQMNGNIYLTSSPFDHTVFTIRLNKNERS